MRRLVVSVLMGFGLVVIGSGAASAEPVPGASAAQAVAGKKICKVTDAKLDELSGMVATEDGFVVVNDGSPLDSHKRIFFLDAKCKIVKNVQFSGTPRDTEDLILSPDGRTLWIADIGDNAKERPTIGLWSMPADGSKKPKIHRLAYPEGKHDAEALLLNGDGTPIIVTKEAGKPAALYTPAAALKEDNTEGVPMKKVGEVTVPASDTSANTLARLLRGSIDGGAVAQGGAKVALRTYTDALEWDVTGGDVLAALKTPPRVTPLPDEQLGEAITYSPDGKYFYTVSDMQGKPEEADNYILRYSPVAKVAPNKVAAADGKGGDSGTSWYTDLSINDITYAVGAVGVLGAILVGLGIFGIMRARKRPQPLPALDPVATDPETELLTVGGAAAGRGVYGSGRPGAGGPVYGAKGSGVYGGNRPPPGGEPRPGAGQPQRPGAVGQPPRPGQGGQPARPGQGGQPQRPGQGGQPARPGQGQPARPGQGQPARPGQGQPARPGQGQPARPGQGGQPARPGQGGQPARPGPVGQPPRPGQGGQPARPGPGGGQPVRRPGSGQPQPGGRPGQGGGGGGVYGAPPANPPQGPQRGAQGQRPSGFFGPGGGRPDQMNNSRGRDFDNRGYGR